MKNLSIKTLFTSFFLPAVVFICSTDKCGNSAQVKQNSKNQLYGGILLKVVRDCTPTLEEVELLLKEITDVNMVVGKYGETLLMEASYSGQTDIVELFLEKGAKPDMEDNYGETALMRASRIGHPKVVRRLIEKGADISKKDNILHQTALQQASTKSQQSDDCKRRLEEVVRLLKPVKKEKCVVDPYNSAFPYVSPEEIREAAAIAERTNKQ